MNTGNIKQFIGVAAISLLTACGSPTPDAVLLKPGVCRELAQFRKEHFKEVRYNLIFFHPGIPRRSRHRQSGYNACYPRKTAGYHRLPRGIGTGSLSFVEWQESPLYG